MEKYKVVCNRKNCWTKSYDDLVAAKTAAGNHKIRLGHNPVYIYKIKEEHLFTSTQLLAFDETELEELDISIIFRV